MSDALLRALLPIAKKANSTEVIIQAFKQVDPRIALAICRATSADLAGVEAIDHARVGKENALMTDAFEVIVGLHRVKAFRSMGKVTIPAIVVEADDLHAELMLIDENLVRNELSPAQRSAVQARRKAIWQILHPETMAGTAQGDGMKRKAIPRGQFGHEVKGMPRYDKAAATTTGQSERAIRREVHRGEVLGDAVLARVAGTSLDKGEELDALAKLPPESRDAMVARAAAGEKISVKTVAKQAVRNEREKTLGERQSALPDKKYGAILADPEHRYDVWSRATGLDRAADRAALRSAGAALVARQVRVADAVASVASAMSSDDAPAETPRERAIVTRKLRRERMVAEMLRLEGEGRGREAPMLVARAFAGDRRDPIEIESLARKLRRWRGK